MLATSCASASKPSPVSRPLAPAATRPRLIRSRPLVAEADAALRAGLAAADAGHLERARAEFDRATDLLLSFPGGALADPRVAEAYRRTLETVQVREIEMLAAGDGFTETDTEPASIDEIGKLPVGESPTSPQTRAQAVAAVAGRVDRPADRAQRGGPLLHRPVPGPGARVVRRGPGAGASPSPPHPPGLRVGRHPPGPRLRRPGRERLQDERLLAREGARGLAVHQRDRQALWARNRLVGRRAQRSGQGHSRGRPLSEGPPRDVRRLEPRPGRLQRRRGQGAARHAALRHRGLLGAAPDARAAGGDEELRAAHPRRDRDRQGAGALRLHGRPRARPRVRARCRSPALSTCA